ncbi:hypothetical protein NXS19_003090 [Fusarium pseudograminearum]|nr:hypothetical protein NXS19_003090 [Fusarium pseudograminearum]
MDYSKVSRRQALYPTTIATSTVHCQTRLSRHKLKTRRWSYSQSKRLKNECQQLTVDTRNKSGIHFLHPLANIVPVALSLKAVSHPIPPSHLFVFRRAPKTSIWLVQKLTSFGKPNYWEKRWAVWFMG